MAIQCFKFSTINSLLRVWVLMQNNEDRYRNISGSIHRSFANRLDDECRLSRSTDVKTDRILLELSSAGGDGGGELLFFGLMTKRIISPITTSAKSSIALRLVVRR